jgi:asparagine N-glycosylation enzyme membrane subunit Stt3
MNKRIVAVITIIAVAAVVIAAISYYSLTQKSKELPTSTEHVGGKYNVTLSFFNRSGAQMEYTDETGSHSGFMYFEPQMRIGLDWIKNATPENAVFLCWWDYGHMIKGYAERSVVARNPSHEWINMIAEPWRSQVTEFDPNEKIVDIAKALTTINSTETLQTMQKYGATYVVVYKDDLLKSSWMYKVAELDPPTQYITYQNSTYTFTDAGMNTMISRLLDNRDTGFTLVYQDASMKVYKIE